MGLGRPRLAVSLPPTTGRHSRAFTGACHASFERVRPHPSPAAPLAFARPLGMRVPPAIASVGSCRVHRKLGRQEPDAQPPMSAGCCVSSCREGGRPGPPLHTDVDVERAPDSGAFCRGATSGLVPIFTIPLRLAGHSVGAAPSAMMAEGACRQSTPRCVGLDKSLHPNPDFDGR